MTDSDRGWKGNGFSLQLNPSTSTSLLICREQRILGFWWDFLILTAWNSKIRRPHRVSVYLCLFWLCRWLFFTWYHGNLLAPCFSEYVFSYVVTMVKPHFIGEVLEHVYCKTHLFLLLCILPIGTLFPVPFFNMDSWKK